MAIVVEDGTGLSNAVSYISLVDATAYFEARGVETWADVGDTVAQEAALVRATFALDAWLRGRWTGKKKTSSQSLAWPRTDVIDEEGYEVPSDVVPTPVKHACCEVALIELSGSFLTKSVSNENAVSSTSVGPVSVSYRSDAPTVTTYPHIEAMLRGLAATGGTQMNFGVSLTQDEIDALDNGTDMFDYEEYFNLVKWG